MYAVWDVDDVLVQMANQVVKRSRELGHTCPDVVDWRHYHFGEYIGLETEAGMGREQVLKWLSENSIMEQCEPFEHARESLEMARDMGLRNVLLTARGWHAEGARITSEMFRKYGLSDLLYGMIVVDVHASKVDKLREIDWRGGEIAIFVEDSPKHAVEAALAGYTVALIDSGWNRHVSHYNIRRFRNTLEAMQDLQKLRDGNFTGMWGCN